MNISSIFNSKYLTNITNRQIYKADTVSSATRTQTAQKPDALSSATVTKGGDHLFEARG